MIKQNLLECKQLERSEDEVTARAGLKSIPSDSGTGDWLLRIGKGFGIEGMDKDT